MEYSTPIFISFRQADAAGILFYSQVFEIHHQVLEKWCATQPFGWNGWFASTTWAVPIRQTQCEYQSPIFAGREYLYNLRVSHLGRSSCQFHGSLTSSDEVLAQVSSTHVFIDKTQGRPQSIPSHIRSCLA